MRSSNLSRLSVVTLLLVACATAPIVTESSKSAAATAVDPAAPPSLFGPEHFADISDSAARSKALFTEAGKVLTSARCTNCHPAGDSPRQGDQGRIHDPPVARGAGARTNAGSRDPGALWGTAHRVGRVGRRLS